MVFQGVVYEFGFGLAVQFLHESRLISRHGLDREVQCVANGRQGMAMDQGHEDFLLPRRQGRMLAGTIEDAIAAHGHPVRQVQAG